MIQELDCRTSQSDWHDELQKQCAIAGCSTGINLSLLTMPFILIQANAMIPALLWTIQKLSWFGSDCRSVVWTHDVAQYGAINQGLIHAQQLMRYHVE